MLRPERSKQSLHPKSTTVQMLTVLRKAACNDRRGRRASQSLKHSEDRPQSILDLWCANSAYCHECGQCVCLRGCWTWHGDVKLHRSAQLALPAACHPILHAIDAVRVHLACLIGPGLANGLLRCVRWLFLVPVLRVRVPAECALLLCWFVGQMSDASKSPAMLVTVTADSDDESKDSFKVRHVCCMGVRRLSG